MKTLGKVCIVIFAMLNAVFAFAADNEQVTKKSQSFSTLKNEQVTKKSQSFSTLKNVKREVAKPLTLSELKKIRGATHYQSNFRYGGQQSITRSWY